MKKYTFHLNFTAHNDHDASELASEFVDMLSNGAASIWQDERFHEVTFDAEPPYRKCWAVTGVDASGALDWSVHVDLPERTITDDDALNIIAGWLSGEQWEADDLDRIATLVRSTGRRVEDVK